MNREDEQELEKQTVHDIECAVHMLLWKSATVNGKNAHTKAHHIRTRTLITNSRQHDYVKGRLHASYVELVKNVDSVEELELRMLMMKGMSMVALDFCIIMMLLAYCCAKTHILLQAIDSTDIFDSTISSMKAVKFMMKALQLELRAFSFEDLHNKIMHISSDYCKNYTLQPQKQILQTLAHMFHKFPDLYDMSCNVFRSTIDKKMKRIFLPEEERFWLNI